MRLAAKLLLQGLVGCIAFTEFMDLVFLMDLFGKRFLPKGSIAFTKEPLPSSISLGPWDRLSVAEVIISFRIKSQIFL